MPEFEDMAIYCTMDFFKQEYLVINMFFYFSIKNICGRSLEAPRRGASNEHPQMFFMEKLRNLY